MDNGETQTYDSTTAAECMKATFQWQEQNFKGSELQRDPSPKKTLEQRDDSWVLRAPTLVLGEEVQQETGTKVVPQACIETASKPEHAAATGQEGTTEASKELEKAALQAEAAAMEDARNGLVSSGNGDEPKETPHVPLDKNSMVNGRVLPKGWCNIPFLTPAEQQPKAQAKRKAKAKAKSKTNKVEQTSEDVEVPEAPKGRKRKADPSNVEQTKKVEVPEAPKGRQAKARASKPKEEQPQQHVEVPEAPKGRKRKADPSNVEQTKKVEVPEAPKGRQAKAKASKPKEEQPQQHVEVPEAPKGRKRKAVPSFEQTSEDVEVPEAPKGRKRKADPEQAKQKQDVAEGGASKGSRRNVKASKGEDKDEDQQQDVNAERKARYSRKSCAYKTLLSKVSTMATTLKKPRSMHRQFLSMQVDVHYDVVVN